MQTAYLNPHLLKVGDEVVTWVDTKPDERDIRESAFWSMIPADGTSGRIVSYERRTIVSAPGSSEFPILGLGIFSYDNVPIVLFDGYEMPVVVASGYIALQDQNEWQARVEAFRQSRIGVDYKTGRRNEALAQNVMRMSDLPEDLLMMGDVVAAPPGFGGVSHAVVRSATMDREAGYGRVPAAHVFSYDIQFYDGNQTAGSTKLSHDELKLVSRGKPWQYYVDNSATFDDLDEKAGFLLDMLQIEEIRNPANGIFKWTASEVREAMRAGTVDYVREGFGKTSTSAYRFDDSEFGRLYRESMLAQIA